MCFSLPLNCHTFSSAGVITDVSGGYVMPFLVMGSCYMVGFGVFLLQPLAVKLFIIKTKRNAG